eukprot:7684768-Alexandrium_andersonii.AAC.1
MEESMSSRVALNHRKHITKTMRASHTVASSSFVCCSATENKGLASCTFRCASAAEARWTAPKS